MKRNTGLIWLIVLLVLVSLACAESGEILSPAEATIAAQEQSSFQPSSGDSIVTSGPQIGDEATMVGRGLVINLFNEPGGRISAGEAQGSTVEVIDIAEFEGELSVLGLDPFRAVPGYRVEDRDLRDTVCGHAFRCEGERTIKDSPGEAH